MDDRSILWRRLDRPGHEFVRLSFAKSLWHLAGTAIFLHDGKPTALTYDVACDADWRTVFGRVAGWVGSQAIQVALSVDSQRRWRLNGRERPDVAGCLDLDLNFSPSTNLLPIRRLKLKMGEQATLNAAWLRFPEFTLERLEQAYRRVAPWTYRYESAGGRFVKKLSVNRTGFVTNYPGFWRAENMSRRPAE